MEMDEFMSLKEGERIKATRRAIRASENLNNKSALPCQRDIEILVCSLKWMGMEDVIELWERRVFKKQTTDLVVKINS